MTKVTNITGECPFARTSLPGRPVDVYGEINLRSQCPDKLSTRNFASLEDPSAVLKGEFYYLLQKHIPLVIESMRDFKQKSPPYGIVKGKDDSKVAAVHLDTNMFTDASFLERGGKLFKMLCQTYRCAIDNWALKCAGDTELATEYSRMSDLIDDRLKERYGAEVAVKERMFAAMANLANVATGMQSLILEVFSRENGRVPTFLEMKTIFANSIELAMEWSDLHIQATKAIGNASRVGRENDHTIREFNNSGIYCIKDLHLALKEEIIIDMVAWGELPTADGRFGCPGRKYIAPLWRTFGELSSAFVYFDFANNPAEQLKATIDEKPTTDNINTLVSLFHTYGNALAARPSSRTNLERGLRLLIDNAKYAEALKASELPGLKDAWVDICIERIKDPAGRKFSEKAYGSIEELAHYEKGRDAIREVYAEVLKNDPMFALQALANATNTVDIYDQVAV